MKLADSTGNSDQQYSKYEARRAFFQSRKYHSVSCMAESVMLCFVQGFEDRDVVGKNKEPKLQAVKKRFLLKKSR